MSISALPAPFLSVQTIATEQIIVLWTAFWWAPMSAIPPLTSAPIANLSGKNKPASGGRFGRRFFS